MVVLYRMKTDTKYQQFVFAVPVQYDKAYNRLHACDVVTNNIHEIGVRVGFAALEPRFSDKKETKLRCLRPGGRNR